MELVLIRHGKAEGHGLLGGDGQRDLVAKGEEQARRVGTFLKREGLVPELALSSPLLRAKRTAEIVCAHAGTDGPPLVESWLACGMRPEIALQELAAYRETCARVALFGHEPDFSRFVEHLIEADPGTVRVKKASVILLTVDPPHEGGVLHFNIWPTQLPEGG
jgi:phosphohistidine phosphatase